MTSVHPLSSLRHQCSPFTSTPIYFLFPSTYKGSSQYEQKFMALITHSTIKKSVLILTALFSVQLEGWLWGCSASLKRNTKRASNCKTTGKQSFILPFLFSKYRKTLNSANSSRMKYNITPCKNYLKIVKFSLEFFYRNYGKIFCVLSSSSSTQYVYITY